MLNNRIFSNPKNVRKNTYMHEILEVEYGAEKINTNKKWS